jgi:mRNA-degrading endonuclease RelE of RelBE toxin-antitoxin system
MFKILIEEDALKEWSKQQKKLIDSQIKSAREFLKKNPEIAEILLRKLDKRTIGL